MSPIQLTRRDNNLNAQYWKKRAESIQYRFEVLNQSIDQVYASFDFSIDRVKRPTLQSSVSNFCQLAFEAYFIGEKEKSRQFSELAIYFANETLRLKDYEIVFAGRSHLTPDLIGHENARGRMQTLLLLDYAQWLLLGKRSSHLLRQASEAAVEMYSLAPPHTPVDDVIQVCIEAKSYSEAIDIFHRSRKKKQTINWEQLTYKTQFNTFALIAEWQNGNHAVEENTRKGIEFWYARAQRWWQIHTDLLWLRRLSWAWLYSQYVIHTTDHEFLLNDLKGCLDVTRID